MPVQVLVIEDDGPLRAEILDFLVRRRHQVTGCGTLAEATEALKKPSRPCGLTLFCPTFAFPMAMA